MPFLHRYPLQNFLHLGLDFLFADSFFYYSTHPGFGKVIFRKTAKQCRKNGKKMPLHLGDAAAMTELGDPGGITGMP